MKHRTPWILSTVFIAATATAASSSAGAQTRRAEPPAQAPAASRASAPAAEPSTEAGAPAPSSARSTTLAMGTRPAFVHGALGFSAGGGVGFNLLAAAGYHFFGNSSGPALSGELQMNVAGWFGLLPGARFAWDIPIANLPVYLSPSARLGVAMTFGQEVFAALDIQPAFDVKVVLFDRLLLFARPVGIDIYIPLHEVAGFRPPVGVGYQFLLGAGATF